MSTSKGPFIFKQNRLGKKKEIFTIYKIRTMMENAEELKKNYTYLNEADGPAFKIKDDPRYTNVGKFISQVGLDELPQLINVIKGEMNLVGPRPLPIYEAKKIPKKYWARFSILPGITSSWVVSGSHRLTFDQWMKKDLQYIKIRSLAFDAQILLKTLLIIVRSILGKLAFKNE